MNRQLLSGVVLMMVLVILALGVPMILNFNPDRIDLPARLKPPFLAGGTLDHLFGTDQLGRDVLMRSLYAGRVSLLIGLVASTFSATLGSLAGLFAGYYEGWRGGLIIRLAEVQQVFPFIVFAIAIIAVAGAGLVPLLIALTLGGWYTYARIAFAETRVCKQHEFVASARSVGATSARILRLHLLPNVLPPLIVMYSFNIASAIIAESSLSFLGLGVPPTVPSWGSMISDGRGFIETAWWLSAMPGILLFVAVLAANLMGDGLRAALDPRRRRRKILREV